MNIKIDTALFKRTCNDARRRYHAMKIAVSNIGTGEVLVSKRTKLPHEKSKALHGRAIANMLADKGHDAFNYPDQIFNQAHKRMEDAIKQAIEKAYTNRRADTKAIKEAITGAAQFLVDWAKENILKGMLGSLSEKTIKEKQKLADRGIIPKENVGIYGNRTGRFIGIRTGEGFRSRFRSQSRSVRN